MLTQHYPGAASRRLLDGATAFRFRHPLRCGVYLTSARRMEGGNGKGGGRQVMKELSLAERHIQESEEHVARIVARIEEFKGLGLTQAANEKRVTLLAL